MTLSASGWGQINDIFRRHPLCRVEAAAHIEIMLEKLEYIIRFEADVGVDEHQVCCLRIRHHAGDEIVACPCHQAIRVRIERELEPFLWRISTSGGQS